MSGVGGDIGVVTEWRGCGDGGGDGGGYGYGDGVRKYVTFDNQTCCLLYKTQ